MRRTAYRKIVRYYTEFRCEVCGKKWLSALKRPKRCGKCKSPYWDRVK